MKRARAGGQPSDASSADVDEAFRALLDEIEKLLGRPPPQGFSLPARELVAEMSKREAAAQNLSAEDRRAVRASIGTVERVVASWDVAIGHWQAENHEAARQALMPMWLSYQMGVVTTLLALWGDLGSKSPLESLASAGPRSKRKQLVLSQQGVGSRQKVKDEKERGVRFATHPDFSQSIAGRRSYADIAKRIRNYYRMIINKRGQNPDDHFLAAMALKLGKSKAPDQVVEKPLRLIDYVPYPVLQHGQDDISPAEVTASDVEFKFMPWSTWERAIGKAFRAAADIGAPGEN